MKTLKLKALGMIAVWVDFIMTYLNGITAAELIRKTAKVTILSAVSIISAVVLYIGLVVACAVC